MLEYLRTPIHMTHGMEFKASHFKSVEYPCYMVTSITDNASFTTMFKKQNHFVLEA